jgi:MFS family permease
VLTVLAALAAQIFGNPQQFIFVGIGAYATFSWACGLRASDRETFEYTWGSLAFMAIVLAYAAVSYVGYTITYWASPYAERTFAFSKIELGLLVGAPTALGGFLGVILGGLLADVLARRFVGGRLLVACIPLFGTIPLLLIGFSTESSTVFLICNFLANSVTASALGACGAASQALVQPRMRGTATAIFLLGATLIGLGLGPFMAGFISESTGSLAVGIISSLAAVAPGLVALILALRRYRPALI